MRVSQPAYSIKDHAATAISDDAFEKRAERWPESTPDTKEAYFIREIFDGISFFFWLVPAVQNFSTIGLFPLEAAAKTAVRYVFYHVDGSQVSSISYCRWIPRGDWGCSSDPSGRSVSIHNAAYETSS